jgi:transcriptional regulator with XRE-family HTH domain
MLERIKKIMEEKGLNQTRFAEATGINPASLSGIINRPDDRKATLDMVTKILSRFEDINSEWLLLGIGPMYKSDSVNMRIINDSGNNTQQEPDLFQSPANINQTDKQPVQTPSYSSIKQPVDPTKTNDGRESTVNRQGNTSQIIAGQPTAPQNNTLKKIDRLTIFYTDQTFENFFPEK